MSIYPWKSITISQSPFVQVFENVGIAAAAGIINFVVLTAAASACNSSIFSTGRMMFSLTYKGSSKFEKDEHSFEKTSAGKCDQVFNFGNCDCCFGKLRGSEYGTFPIYLKRCDNMFPVHLGSNCHCALKIQEEFERDKKSSEANFKMPFYPLSDYLVLAFLAFVCVVMCLEKQRCLLWVHRLPGLSY